MAGLLLTWLGYRIICPRTDPVVSSEASRTADLIPSYRTQCPLPSSMVLQPGHSCSSLTNSTSASQLPVSFLSTYVRQLSTPGRRSRESHSCRARHDNRGCKAPIPQTEMAELPGKAPACRQHHRSTTATPHMAGMKSHAISCL